ncbi:odorant receptor 4-like isoform X1 [Linepithema humile]|uniref:odorant receptor 4-like isoform X1 n=2 Tax=Linepithema humile TaxID=83485 RepID=UPI00351DCBD0
MPRKITLESAIVYIKWSLVLSLSWPLPITATKWQIIRFKILAVLSHINIVCFLVPLLILIQDCSDQRVVCIQSYPLICGCFHFWMSVGICHIQYKRFQSLIAEMESYCKHATDYEKTVLQQYVDRCATFYAVVMISFYSTTCVAISAPLFTSAPFPTYAKYPFDVNYQPLKTIIYAQQSLSGLQFSSMLCVSLLVALLLWFTTARFDILCNELRKALTVYELIQCIQKHQQLLRYANDVIENVRFLVLTVVGANAISVICTGAIFATRQPLIINVQFFLMTVISFCDVFTCCWPADSLLTASSDIAQATYESLWYYHNTDKQKNLIFILLKCRKPVILTVGCFIPILSLRYFSSYLSTGFSYMTTLHMMMTENNTNEV